MNQKPLFILTLSLFIAFSIVLFRLDRISNDLNTLRNEHDSLMRDLRSNIQNMARELQSIIEHEASPLEFAQVTFGDISKDNLSVEVMFSIVLKETTPTTQVYLEIENDVFPLERLQSSFNTTIEVSVFSNQIIPVLIIEDQGMQRFTLSNQLNRFDLRGNLLPSIETMFHSGVRLTKDSISLQGDISLFIRESHKNVEFVNLTLLYVVDNEVIDTQSVNPSVLKPFDGLIVIPAQFSKNINFVNCNEKSSTLN